MERTISKLSWGKGNKLKEGHGGLPREGGVSWVEKKEKEDKEWKKKEISSYVWKGVVHERHVCKN